LTFGVIDGYVYVKMTAKMKKKPIPKINNAISF